MKTGLIEGKTMGPASVESTMSSAETMDLLRNNICPSFVDCGPPEPYLWMIFPVLASIRNVVVVLEPRITDPSADI
eukprot:Gb_20658 [translate_table: standard]